MAAWLCHADSTINSVLCMLLFYYYCGLYLEVKGQGRIVGKWLSFVEV